MKISTWIVIFCIATCATVALGGMTGIKQLIESFDSSSQSPFYFSETVKLEARKTVRNMCERDFLLNHDALDPDAVEWCGKHPDYYAPDLKLE